MSIDDASPSREGATPSRRDFLKRTAAGLLSATLGADGVAHASKPDPATAPRFRSRWPRTGTRVWVGPEYWSNPLQDWRIAEGRLEMVGGGSGRNVHHLTRQVGTDEGDVIMAVRTGIPRGSGGQGAGFLIGVRGPLNEYRNNVIHGVGLRAGIAGDGRLFVEDGGEAALPVTAVDGGVILRLAAAPAGSGYTLTLSAHDPLDGTSLASVSRTGLTPRSLKGNVALFADADEGGPRGSVRAWFTDWEVAGSGIQVHDDRAFGPILFAQHTLSRGILKLTAQLPPIGAEDDATVRLDVRAEGASDWSSLATAPVDPLSRTASFRVEGWDDGRDVPYRLAYRLRQDGEEMREHHFTGTIRRDPVDRDELVVAGLSCMVDAGFPNTEIARGVRHHDPDILFFVGDQLYEGTGGFGVQRTQDVELGTLDYLRKWYLYGWSFADLMRDRPTICITDDHDVYQGNIWGEGGEDPETYDAHSSGGYYMPPEWVNMVQRTQTSHLPDPYDATPVQQGITVYYTDLLYGRVSFALLEDRKWKSGPAGLIPPHPGRIDHIVDPDYDVRLLDVPGAVLLGERQHRFIEAWAGDWRGADMKVAVSQTIFAQVPNIHGNEEQVLATDLDANGWPQTPRDEALRLIRKAFAFHLCGDQHLPMMVHCGVDDWEDAAFAFVLPAIATGYPRSFLPTRPGENRAPGAPAYTGRFLDGLRNRVTVHAVANPSLAPRGGVLERLADRVSGYGIVRLDKAARRITMECWPILSDPRAGPSAQFSGWPKTISVEENYRRPAVAHLPTLQIEGTARPIVQIVEEEAGEVVYTLRTSSAGFRPKVFRAGTYTVRVGDDDGWRATVEGVATTDDPTMLRIRT